MRYRLLVAFLLFASIGCEDKQLAYMKARDKAIDEKAQEEKFRKEMDVLTGKNLRQ